MRFSVFHIAMGRGRTSDRQVYDDLLSDIVLAEVIYAFTNQVEVRRKLWMVRSIVPMHTELFEQPEKTVQSAMLRLRERNRLLPGDPVVVVSDIDAGEERVTTIQIRTFR